jgi:fucose 4-O-acetylase-like acetyltransferase
MQRNTFLDFCKGVLILLVAVGHAAQFAAYQDAAFWTDPLFKSIYMFHMPLFMAVSGYVSFRGISGAPAGSFIRSRLLSYLMPIAVWAALFQLALSSLTGDPKLTALPLAIIREALTSLWFLWALLAGLIFAAIANKFGKFSLPAAIGFFVLLLVLPDKGNLYLIKYTFPFFLVGYYAAAVGVKSFSAGQLRALTAVSGIGACLCFFLWQTETYIYVSRMSLAPANLPHVGLRYVAGAVVSIFALCLFYYAYLGMHHRLRGALIVAGRDSLYIYILSGYAFIYLLKLSRQYFEPAANPFVAAAIAVSIGTAVAVLSWAIGSALASNRFSARILFGKTQRPPAGTPVVSSALNGPSTRQV